MSQAVRSAAVAGAMVGVLRGPSPKTLRELRAALWLAGWPAGAPIWPVLDQFHTFLADLSARASAREYSHFASLLDMGAVGGVALQNLLSQDRTDAFWQRLISGGLSEALMVIAARQYVKAWDEEMTAVYRAAAWYLAGAWWELSTASLPGLDPIRRRQLVDQLVAPLDAAPGASALPGTAQAALITRLFQLLLVAYLLE